MPETVTIYSDEELGLEPGWDTNPEDGQPLSPAIRRELRGSRIARKERDAAVRRAETAERQLALAGAGIPQDERGKFFAEHYDGPSDPASVKAQWEALFGPEGSGGAGDDTAGQRRIAELGAGESGGSSGAGGQTVEEWQAELRAARGNKQLVRAILAKAPPETGIRLKDQIQ